MQSSVEFRKRSVGQLNPVRSGNGNDLANQHSSGLVGNGDNSMGASNRSNGRDDSRYWEMRCKNVDEELANLRDLLKKRDSEIDRLKREVHKLKVSLGQLIILIIFVFYRTGS